MVPKKDPVLVARSAIGNAYQLRKGPKAIAEARRDLAAAHVERAIDRALAAAPPITKAQRERLAHLLLSGM